MKRIKPNAKVVGWAFAASGLLGAWWGYERVYAQPRRAVEEELTSARQHFERTQADVNTLPQVTRQIRDLAAGQLGQTEERVEANLRTALNEIAASAGLSGVVVTTGEAARMKNPAALVSSEWSGSGRGRREQIDFRAMSASLKGVGTLSQALRVLAVVQHQAWAKRVDGFVINPVGDAKERNTVDFTVRLTTVFVPEVTPAETVTAENLWRVPPPEVVAAFGAVVSKNVFREPAKAAVAQKPPPPAPPGPTTVALAYGDWRVVALVKGAAGPELWLNNEKTQQRVMLALGQGVLDAVFVGAEGAEAARVKIGEQEFRVGLAQTLGERQAVTRQQ